jgi:hypothetical protein
MGDPSSQGYCLSSFFLVKSAYSRTALSTFHSEGFKKFRFQKLMNLSKSILINKIRTIVGTIAIKMMFVGKLKAINSHRFANVSRNMKMGTQIAQKAPEALSISLAPGILRKIL